MKIRKYRPFVLKHPLALVHSWDDLGNLLRIKTQTMSYVGRRLVGERGLQRDKMQHLVKVKGRDTYKSDTALARIQDALNALFDHVQGQGPQSHLLAYRKGVDYKRELEKYVGRKYMTHCDIKGYYDNIATRKIVKTLCDLGHMTEAGAKLVARYCVVRRKVDGRWIHTLQQGSPCSPLLSNLVGYALFDRDILAWVADKNRQNPRMHLEYVRYCDNLALFSDGDIPLEILKEYEKMVRQVMGRNGFKTHKWSTTPKNHPFRHQRFLGVVLNEKARVDLARFHRARATLFNACCHSVSHEATKYFSLHDIRPTSFPTQLTLGTGEVELFRTTDKDRCDHFLTIMRGHVAYIQSVSGAQGLVLKKLLEACKYLQGTVFRGNEWATKAELPQAIFDAVKTYNRKEEAVEIYLARVQVATCQALTGKTLEVGNSVTDTSTHYDIAL